MRNTPFLPGSTSQFVNAPLLVLLLCTDFAFIVLHVLNQVSFLPDPLYSLSRDGGHGESFQYIKELWIVLMLFAVVWRTRERVFAVWALLFLYILCDDALRIHETVGESVAARWTIPPLLGLRALDLGEFAFSAAMGCVFLAAIAYHYAHASDEGRKVSQDLVLLLAVLAFFGVFFDMAHAALKPVLSFKGFTLIEDGGEMVTMSLITSYVANLFLRRAAPTTSIARLLKTSLTAGLRSHTIHTRH